MINIKNIVKVLVIALFVCAWSGDVWAKACPDGTPCDNGTCVKTMSNAAAGLGGEGTDTYMCKKEEKKNNESPDTSGQGGVNPADFCTGEFGLFSELVSTGRLIFNRLRDLIYVVAGFGIIAVAVGGFFGNLNWKWLGAIVISLVVIATAGELIVLMTGCETFGSSLITNTLSNNAPTMTTEEYNATAMEESTASGGRIQWDDSMDISTDWTGKTGSVGGDDTTGTTPPSGDGALPTEAEG